MFLTSRRSGGPEKIGRKEGLMRPQGPAKTLLLWPTVSLTAMMSTELPPRSFASLFPQRGGGSQIRKKLSPPLFGEGLGGGASTLSARERTLVGARLRALSDVSLPRRESSGMCREAFPFRDWLCFP